MPKYRVKTSLNFSPKDADRVESAVGDGLELTALKMKEHIVKNASATFDNSGPKLIMNLWDSGAKFNRRGVHIKTGWSFPVSKYGWVLEFGPDVSSWTIEPRKAKALRFYSRKTGKIVFAKHVKFHWTNDMLRPHWQPALEEETPHMVRRLNDALVRNGTGKNGG